MSLDEIIKELGEELLSMRKIPTDQGNIWAVDTTIEPSFTFSDKDLHKALAAALSAKLHRNIRNGNELVLRNSCLVLCKPSPVGGLYPLWDNYEGSCCATGSRDSLCSGFMGEVADFEYQGVVYTLIYCVDSNCYEKLPQTIKLNLSKSIIDIKILS